MTARHSPQILLRLWALLDDLPPAQWGELEKIIEEHPVRIRKGTFASTA